MMNKLCSISSLLLLTFFVIAVCGAHAQRQNWMGYLIDGQSLVAAKAQGDVRDYCSHYPRKQALKPTSQKAGYALFSNGNVFYFDKHGNDLAIAVIKANIKDSGFYVLVQGHWQDGVIQAASINSLIDTRPAKIK